MLVVFYCVEIRWFLVYMWYNNLLNLLLGEKRKRELDLRVSYIGT